MRLFKKFRDVTICSAAVSILCFFTGVVISYLYAVPTGASVVLINIAVFLLFWLLKLIKEGGIMNITGTALLICIFLVMGCGGVKNAAVQTNNAGTLSVRLPSSAEPEPARPAVNNGDEVIEIKEKMFIAQTNDVYLNAEDYLGKTIKLEGIFVATQYEGRKDPYCFVIRYGPGCCGNDGNAGFEVIWNTQQEKDYPGADAWVEAIGTLKTYEEDGYPYLYLALTSLNVLDKRGAEFVTQ
jgi:hypothetical protein